MSGTEQPEQADHGEPDRRVRFPRGSRGRILRLLRGTQRTAAELAAALEMTPNGVRGHLALLERDGLVGRAGLQRGGVGKPAVLFRLTREGESVFRWAHGEVLSEVLGALRGHLAGAESARLLRDAGARLARRLGLAAEEGVRARLPAAVEALEALGGKAEMERMDGHALLRGASCPLGDVSSREPGVCRVAEGILEAVLGLPVREECERGDRPRCRFRVELSGEGP